MIILDSINTLIHSPYPNTQLDIYYQKRVVLHIFDQKNTKSWKLNPEIELNIGLLILIFFNGKHKKYLNNFVNSNYRPKFSKVKLGKQEVYLFPLEYQLSSEEITEIVSKFLIEVFDLESNDEIEITLNSY